MANTNPTGGAKHTETNNSSSTLHNMSRLVPILRLPNPFNFGYPQINGQFQHFPGVEAPVLSLYLPIPYANNPSSSPSPTPAQTPNSPAIRPLSGIPMV
jgi:hypothetical protein